MPTPFKAPLAVKIDGLDRLLALLEKAPLWAGPLRDALSQIALTVESGAKRLAPVDTGRLRASITHRVDAAPVPRWAEVGTNVAYAAAVHEGRSPGKMPPVAAIQTWVHHKGLGGTVLGQGRIRRAAESTEHEIAFTIARKIGRYGTKGRPFLTDAVEQARGAIAGLLDRAAKEVGARWRG